MYANGVWRYQKFHSYPEIAQRAEYYFGEQFTVYNDEGRTAKDPIRSTSWGVVAVKDKALRQEDCGAALVREFNLPLPDGKSYGRSADILAAWQDALQREAGEPCALR